MNFVDTLIPSNSDIRFLRLPDVMLVTGLSKSSIYALIRANSFPHPSNLDCVRSHGYDRRFRPGWPSASGCAMRLRLSGSWQAVYPGSRPTTASS